MLWRLRSGTLFSSATDPGGGAQRVEAGEGATTVGAEVLPVDEGTDAVDQVDGPSEQGGDGTPFETGGVVPGPKGSPHTVAVHAGERVRPTTSARRQAWVDYVDDISSGEARTDTMTKAELIDLADRIKP